ncbi:nucleoside deaminase [Candidatus Sulfidibacterium hydrothermale]|uniref:nucleoside deaminase n=1 Tax=Candidatus Sulfidibacterium hydrothermale TaxID=2875962 RepID=UPI001F0B1629|nr:nucleoside deaminase [Candidatus Sulfidibacterium hydrothermale]UBM62436.1 nucleoside deaminase [Candidatus Sulfidibacterium hydrothermale]
MELTVFSDEYFMNEALKEAQKAYDAGEVPVGAVVVCSQRIVARTHNLTETLHDVTAHAEMQAFTAAANFLGSKYLNDCTLYVTLEPCVMCAGGAFWSQIGKIVYGAKDEKRGFTQLGKPVLHPATKVENGVLADACSKILSDFFRSKR